MRVDFLYPTLPPAFDAIGESTVELARAMSTVADIRLLCAPRPGRDVVPGVSVAEVLTGGLPRSVLGAESAIRAEPPDWIIVPYNPFSYGPRGINPWLPTVLRRIRRELPETRIAILAHELFAPARGVRGTVLSLAQRAQFYALGRSAHAVFFSTGPWRERYEGWFPDAVTETFAIGSNLPTVSIDRALLREQWGIRPDQIVLTTFGALGWIRDRELMQAAYRAVSDSTAVACYVGSSAEDFRALTSAVGIKSLIFERPEGEVAAGVLAGSDICLAPFVDGVSDRRGSFLAGLQQGTASVTTFGPLTGRALSTAATAGDFAMVASRDPAAFASCVLQLAEAPGQRQEMGERGRRYYLKNHDWPVVGNQVYELLRRPGVGAGSWAEQQTRNKR